MRSIGRRETVVRALLDPLAELRSLRDEMRLSLARDAEKLSAFERQERQNVLGRLDATIRKLEERGERRGP